MSWVNYIPLMEDPQNLREQFWWVEQHNRKVCTITTKAVSFYRAGCPDVGVKYMIDSIS